MSLFFFDSSAIAKRYLNEIGTGWVRALTDPASGNDCYLAAIIGVEVVSAVARQRRDGALSPTDSALLLAEFRHHFDREYRTIEITAMIIATAMALAEVHALRGYDAVQLAAALELGTATAATGTTLTFVSADTALNTAATAEGLAVEDPDAHP